MLWNCFCVGAGGFLGAVFRYLLGFLPLSDKTQFPVITLGINILGAFAIGVISQAAVRYGISDSRWILFLKTGVCGDLRPFLLLPWKAPILWKRADAECQQRIWS